MNVREAIFRAADHIERNPRDWDFYSGVPNVCGTQGCAVGWVAFYLGHRFGSVFALCEEIFGVSHLEWWRLVMPVQTENRVELTGRELAAMMRAYADKYHPAEKPKHTGIPASVRAIFETKQEHRWLGPQFLICSCGDPSCEPKVAA